MDINALAERLQEGHEYASQEIAGDPSRDFWEVMAGWWADNGMW